MPKPWLKMWVEWQHAPNMVKLSLAEVGAWWRLYTLAHTCGDGGKLVSNDGDPLDRGTLFDCLHIKAISEIRAFDSMVSKQMNSGALHMNGNILIVSDYAEQQSLTPSESKEAVRERVRKYRERHAKTDDVIVPPTTPSKDIDKDIDKIRVEGNGVTSVTEDQEEGVTIDSNVTDKTLQTARNSREKSSKMKRVSRENSNLNGISLPEWINKDCWDGYLEMRRLKKKVPTPRAIELVIKSLTNFREQGQDPNEILDQSTKNGWTDVFALKGDSYGGTRKHQEFTPKGQTTDEERRAGASGVQQIDLSEV